MLLSVPLKHKQTQVGDSSIYSIIGRIIGISDGIRKRFGIYGVLVAPPQYGDMGEGGYG